tara:strand:+ start:793 stop:1083 length:291 start_codon:yes stop_codon:yes gene_type:complete
MSDDKVISMEDFKKTERELTEGIDVTQAVDTRVGWTKVILVGRGDELLTLVEQGYDEGDEENSIGGVAMDYDELLEVMEQLKLCAEKMEELSTDVK